MIILVTEWKFYKQTLLPEAPQFNPVEVIIKNWLKLFYFQEDKIESAVEESNRIREDYQKYFDLEISVEDTEEAFRTIMDSLVKLANESQWVPLNWVYSWS